MAADQEYSQSPGWMTFQSRFWIITDLRRRVFTNNCEGSFRNLERLLLAIPPEKTIAPLLYLASRTLYPGEAHLESPRLVGQEGLIGYQHRWVSSKNYHLTGHDLSVLLDSVLGRTKSF